ncbi:MAG: transcription termination factor Rho [Puniceicoccales bacterium]|jgi:transcription termination factor Rho|nr:transcription termination factor Rho [Puniceicoccales bacterium]
MDREGTVPAAGILMGSGSGPARLFVPCRGERACGLSAAVPRRLIEQFHLRPGQEVVGRALPTAGGHLAQLTRVVTVDGLNPAERKCRMPFLRATTAFPNERLRTETEGGPLSCRLVDLFAPIGKGQRGLIVAPPKAGKTILLQDVARGILANRPDCHLMVLLVDERPEEVTEFRRTVSAEIFASSNDEPVMRHIHMSQLAFRRAQSLAEAGRDVVLLLDSLTRLARAFNCAMARSGRTMSGGLDSQALEQPRQFFAMARATEEVGSLTVLATVLVETGSRMDELIFQEFKGTGNMEIVLDRKAADRRLFPAISLQGTGTRREELLLDGRSREAALTMRRAAGEGRPDVVLGTLLERVGKTQNNGELIRMLTGH